MERVDFRSACGLDLDSVKQALSEPLLNKLREGGASFHIVPSEHISGCGEPYKEVFVDDAYLCSALTMSGVIKGIDRLMWLIVPEGDV